MNMRNPEGPGYIERIDMDEIEQKAAKERAEQARLAEEPIPVGGKADPKIEVHFAGSGAQMAARDTMQVKQVEGDAFNRDRIQAEVAKLQAKIDAGANPEELREVIVGSLDEVQATIDELDADQGTVRRELEGRRDSLNAQLAHLDTNDQAAAAK